jgi:hypothetical protein
MIGGRTSIPWWSVATVVLLSIGLALAVLGGRTLEAIIIGVLLVPLLALLGNWLYWSSRKAPS